MKYREEVAYFAQAMEFKLLENDHKGGWDGAPVTDLFDKLRAEVNELQEAMKVGNDFCIILEAADVANYAMMIAWNLTRGKNGREKNLPSDGREEVAHRKYHPEPEHSRASVGGRGFGTGDN